jgi:hypothetical protein
VIVPEFECICAFVISLLGSTNSVVSTFLLRLNRVIQSRRTLLFDVVSAAVRWPRCTWAQVSLAPCLPCLPVTLCGLHRNVCMRPATVKSSSPPNRGRNSMQIKSLHLILTPLRQLNPLDLFAFSSLANE